MISIFLNGESRTTSAGASVLDLLRELGLAAGALVEHNGRALFPSEWAGVTLAEGDRLEILRVAAGG